MANVKIDLRIAPYFSGIAAEGNPNRDALIEQLPGYYKAVSAIITRPTKDTNALFYFIGEVFKDNIRTVFGGIFHQNDAGNPHLTNCPRIEISHLLPRHHFKIARIVACPFVHTPDYTIACNIVN